MAQTTKTEPKKNPQAGEDAFTEAEGLEVLDKVAEYFERVVVNRVLAERRRKAGDPSASPKDYACWCPVSPADGVPICHRLADNCRFQHRPRPPGPNYWENKVRHAIFKREYRAFIDSVINREIDDDEALRVFKTAIRWS